MAGAAAVETAADALSQRLAAVDLSAPSAGAGSAAAAAVDDDDAAAGGAAPPPGGEAPRVAGLEGPLQALRELIGWPQLYAAEAAALGVSWPRGLLLHGPPGCGKTLLVQQVAAEFGASLHTITAPSVFGAFVGESERRLRDAFASAASEAAEGGLAVVFLDEADALCPRRRAGGGGGGGQHEARVVAQLLTLLDGADAGGGGGGGASGGASGGAAPRGRVVVVAATNRPNALDPALRRPGRLDREVAVPVPGPEQRAAILSLHTSGLRLAPDVDLAALAGSCHGYSGADLAALAREAAMAAFSRAAAAAFPSAPLAGGAAAAGAAAAAAGAAAATPGGGGGGGGGGAGFEESDGLVAAADFLAAMSRVGPSIVRGQAVELPPLAWDEVGGYPQIKRRLQQAVEWPLRHAPAFSRLGLAPPRGVLLHGPPGCSKTMLARAAASGSGATLIPLSCAQLYSMYVGEGDSTLRDAFARARMAAPAIIFLDEADALAPGRGDGGGGGDEGGGGGPDAAMRLLAALLTEMDGLEASPGVLVLAATNRPAALDAALLRPGRLDALIYVPPPDEEGRLATLRIHTRAMPLAGGVDLPALARATAGFTGAEVAALCREAALAALREDIEGASEVAARHFEAARAAAAPALTAAQLAAYESWGRQYAR
ncbi:hypothetical protein Rsub_10047 [Raphidocelis subcapitata]|uniref:AAA+ ATPase domain-containing protein n=1 Tax=Raphidocelis subcapitata TaxID=307507 RepID=A0A2V0PBG6_9CHLO|nr:hypothetical protein Rsub_10047 [Raphidocelis subcapitata]|eukprot:GBF97186.1 hypothetical protein Rsub_10047 [Raphidocelis subcapitata]